MSSLPPDDDPLWYKDAVIYQVHVRSFHDSNGDGIGDFPGLTAKLDYLAALGVSCLWLLPFYPSPLRDDGYDIAHYEDVHPSYGTLRDFRTFLAAAHARGLRVITELVINHTSDQHPWFQAARRAAPGSSKRDFYVWSATPQRYEQASIIFRDTETSNWAWDGQAGAYYWHRFFHHQPDLKFDNPHVLKAVMKAMRFWLELGVDGMRLDAVPYLVERDDTPCENLPETHAVLRALRTDLDERYPGRMLLAEANGWPGDVCAYFGEGDECHMAFNFPLMPRIFLALQQEDVHPVVDIIRQTPDIPPVCQWAIFLRNHDELTLETVTDEERDSLYQAYASDPRMRINLGIRRRLAPLMENNRDRIQLANSLLLSLPGTPVVYYGDEIGMGDNVYLGDRNGVRTPMQWTSDRNGGFSAADPARLFAPVIMDPVYGYQAINVEAQEQSPASLLHWTRRLVAMRRRFRAFGRGRLDFLPPSNRKVLAYVRVHEGETVLCVANFSRHAQPAELDLGRFEGRVPEELLGGAMFPRISKTPYVITLAPYGFYWFLLRDTPEQPTGVRPVPVSAPKPSDTPGLPPLLLGRDWDSAFDTSTRVILERDYLRAHFSTRRWFASRAQTLGDVRIRDHALIGGGPEPAFIALVEVSDGAGQTAMFCAPMAFLAGHAADELAKESPELVIARISGARKGVLHERLDKGVAELLLDAIAHERTIGARKGRVVAAATSLFATLRGPDASLRVERAQADQSNTSFVFADRLILKLLRRVEPGPHPEVEIARHLERAGFTRVPPLAGTIEYDGAAGPITLAILHGLVRQSTSGWAQALDEVDRYFERTAVESPSRALASEHLGWYADALARLGQRTAELHIALANPLGDPAFATEAWTLEDSTRLAARAAQQIAEGFAIARTRVDQFPEVVRAEMAEGLALEPRLLAELADAGSLAAAGLIKARVHGDFHLAQVLWHEGDFSIVDFEGDPDRPLAERRELRSPVDDVAGMVRAFSYAAQSRLAAWREREAERAKRMAPWADLWADVAAEAFLSSYVATAGSSGLVPEPARFSALLRFFLIQKSAEDLTRELVERPTWVPIPLKTLAALARGSGESIC